MSEFLGTRNGIQCRSHHMKQLRTMKKIKMIVKKTKTTMTELQYQRLYDQITSTHASFKNTSRFYTRFTDPKIV